MARWNSHRRALRAHVDTVRLLAYRARCAACRRETQLVLEPYLSDAQYRRVLNAALDRLRDEGWRVKGGCRLLCAACSSAIE